MKTDQELGNTHSLTLSTKTCSKKLSIGTAKVNTSRVKKDSQLTRKVSKFFGSLFGLIYALLFIPALMYIPFLGAVSLTADGVTTFGAALCMLAFATIPLSMPVSVYFIYKYFIRAWYGQMFFFCGLPLLCSVMAPLLTFSIMCLYDPLLIPWLES